MQQTTSLHKGMEGIRNANQTKQLYLFIIMKKKKKGQMGDIQQKNSTPAGFEPALPKKTDVKQEL